GGSWDAADNGTYTVTVNTGQVHDAGGAAVADGATSFFTVDIPVPPPPIDPTFRGEAPAPPPGTPTTTEPPPPIVTGFLTEASATQPDGKVLLAGRRTVNGVSQYVLKRLRADGTVDPSFGHGGEVTSDGSASEAAYAVAIDPSDGGILIAGTR